jgi:cobyrinic acid a,c-diamide synthase
MPKNNNCPLIQPMDSLIFMDPYSPKYRPLNVQACYLAGGYPEFVFAFHSKVARQPQNIGFPIISRRLDIIKLTHISGHLFYLVVEIIIASLHYDCKIT